MDLNEHPTVKNLRASGRLESEASKTIPLTADQLKKLALACGTEGVGIVDINRTELDPQRDEILKNYPWTKSLLSFVVKMARESVRGTARSVSNLEFHRASHATNEIANGIVARLQDVNPIFTWVRLAQRIPVRIHLDHVPDSVTLAAGMTATVSVGPEPRGRRGKLTTWLQDHL